MWGSLGKSWGRYRIGFVALGTIAVVGFCALLWALRNSPYVSDPLFDAYLEMAGSLIAFTFAANAMVRFRGTHDRISLILAFGFVLAGLIEAGSSMTFYRGMLVTPAVGTEISLGWLAGRTLLGVSAAGRADRRAANSGIARSRKRNRGRDADRRRCGVSDERLLFHAAARAEDSSRRVCAARRGTCFRR